MHFLNDCFMRLEYRTCFLIDSGVNSESGGNLGVSIRSYIIDYENASAENTSYFHGRMQDLYMDEL